MKKTMGKRTAVSGAVAMAMAASASVSSVSVAEADDDDFEQAGKYSAYGVYAEGEYKTGDFHNHTSCSDGSTSVRTLTRESLSYLDWFIHVGHSGRGSRNCLISDFLYLNRDSEFNRGLWVNSLPNGAADIKGDPTFETMRTGTAVPAMWRWQSLQEFNFQSVIDVNDDPRFEGKEAFLGLEWVVPGHEHSSNTITTGQYDSLNPNADALAQFEYCFARNSDDTSGGGDQGWTCELSEAGNDKLIELFENRPEEGVADYNSTLVNGINTSDVGEHVKSTAAVIWKEENFPGDGMAVQAHVERQGAFIPDDDEGYNIEHLRDWHTAAPYVAFGFESQPGHQAQPNRGSYNASRPTAGLWTYGGTGCYAAAEAARPGEDFDGSLLMPSDFVAGGKYPEIDDNEDPAKVTLCRPGVRTMWDAMLSEGRRYWFFASSDWHNRGSFGPMDYEATNDFWPGEYQEQYSYVLDHPYRDPAQEIVDSLRSGNSFAVQGQLIDRLQFTACSGGRCATMGETLRVRPGALVRVQIRMRDPVGTNNSPYTFDNPSLKQIGWYVPINKPRVAQVDLISGEVDEQLSPDDPEYYEPLAPKSTGIDKSWGIWDLRANRKGVSRMSYRFRARNDMYVRIRGTNIPAGTQHERDMYGNPLPDNLSNNIPCDDAACPPHINGTLDMDVEAWADLWFYSNPIFIEIEERHWWKSGLQAKNDD